MFFKEEETWLIQGDPRWSFERPNKSRRPVIGIDFTYVPKPLDIEPAQPEPKMGRKKRAWAVRMQRRLNAMIKGRDDEALEHVLGYTREDLVRHLERQFSGRMSWRNYAGNIHERRNRGVWVVDHIVPKRTFTEVEARQAFALSNLRPLWTEQNIAKNMKRTHLL